MKNILAENMLRFGVKNLSNSDVKKINESSLLTENFKGEDGIIYKLDFKDQAAFEKYYTEFPQVLNPIKPPWIQAATNTASEARYDEKMAKWNHEKNHLLQSIMLACAYNGYNTSWYAGLTLDEVKTCLLAGANKNELNTRGLRDVYSGNNASPDYRQAYADFTDNITYGLWEKTVRDPNNKTKLIPYWDYFRNTYITPLVAPKNALIIPKVKPVNPDATKPGVKPVTKTTNPSVKPVTKTTNPSVKPVTTN